MNKKGISLVMLVVTIVVLSILVMATVTGTSIATSNAKKVTFAEELLTVEDSVRTLTVANAEFPDEGVIYSPSDILAYAELANVRTELSNEMLANKEVLTGGGETKFRILNLQKLGVSSATRGLNKDNANLDAYVWSDKTGLIYYIKGYKVGSKTYHSLTNDLVESTKINTTIDSSVASITSAATAHNLQVNKNTEEYTNKLKLFIQTIDRDLAIYTYSIKIGSTEKYVTLNNGSYTLDINSEFTMDELASSTTATVYKHAGSAVLSSKNISIENLDVKAPLITSDDLVYESVAGYNVLKINTVDDRSGIEAYYIDYMLKYKDNKLYKPIENQIANYYSAGNGNNLEIRRYLVENGTKSTTNTFQIPSDVYAYRIVAVDKVGNISNYITNNFAYKAGVPTLALGMTPVKWTADNSLVTTSTSDPEWYNYENKKWANAKSADGSLWTWIPRYAYKITYNNPSNRSLGGKIDVKILDGTTNRWYNSITMALEDIPAGYIVHPAFQDGHSTGYANGEWDSEIGGFWISKFEAGFAKKAGATTDIWAKYQGVPNAVASNVCYFSSGNNQYGAFTSTTKMTYPISYPKVASYNFITTGEAFALAKSMAMPANPYGFVLGNAVPHLFKNSEWGAVTYLSESKYGLNGVTEIAKNNVCLEGSVSGQYIYGITGMSGGSGTAAPTKNINDTSVYNTTVGYTASTTRNVYGVYDLNGGSCERSAGYLANGNGNILNNLKQMADQNNDGVIDNKSDRLVTIFKPASTDQFDSNLLLPYNANQKGNAIYETSIPLTYEQLNNGILESAWHGQGALFCMADGNSLDRGGSASYETGSGAFFYSASCGERNGYHSFRMAITVE